MGFLSENKDFWLHILFTTIFHLHCYVKKTLAHVLDNIYCFLKLLKLSIYQGNGKSRALQIFRILIVVCVNKTPEDESAMIPVFIFVINFRNETGCQ